MKRDEPKPVKPSGRKFQSSFYFALAASIFLLSGFGVGHPAEAPLLSAFALALGLAGWIKAKSLAARILGVLLTGISGGCLVLGLRSLYF